MFVRPRVDSTHRPGGLPQWRKDTEWLNIWRRILIYQHSEWVGYCPQEVSEYGQSFIRIILDSLKIFHQMHIKHGIVLLLKLC